jgi:hypothetical protein
MSRACPRGDDLVREADKRQSNGFFTELIHSGNKYESVVELLNKAATQYKLAQQWQRAAQVHQRASKIELDKLGDSHAACTSLQHAARAYSVRGGTLSCALASACFVSPFHPASYVIGCSSSPETKG